MSLTTLSFGFLFLNRLDNVIDQTISDSQDNTPVNFYKNDHLYMKILTKMIAYENDNDAKQFCIIVIFGKFIAFYLKKIVYSEKSYLKIWTQNCTDINYVDRNCYI